MDLRFQLPIHLHIRTTLINITTTDAYGRTDVDVYTFIIDDEVTSTPTLAITGTQTIINGAPISAQMDELHWITSSMLEASVSIMLNVSGMMAQTHRPTQSSQQHHHSANIASANYHSFTLNCRIVDQVGNIGNNTTISGFVDLQSSNDDDSANEWKHHHEHLNHQLCNNRCKPQRNINGDHHMDQYNQFMEHNGRLQRHMEWVHCRTQQQPG